MAISKQRQGRVAKGGRVAVAPAPAGRRSAGFSIGGLVGALAACAVLSAPAWAHGPLDHQIAILSSELALDPDDAEALLRRADLFRLQGDWSAAGRDLDAVDRLRPGDGRSLYLRGRVLLESGRPGAAIELVGGGLDGALDRGLAQQLQTRVQLLLARAASELGRPLQAASHYREAIALGYALDPQVYLECAEQLAVAGEPRGARECLDAGRARLGPIVALERRAAELEGDPGRPSARPSRTAVATTAAVATAAATAPTSARRAPASATTDTLIATGSEWRYLDDGSEPPFAWVDPGFSDVAWSVGTAPLGYGDPGLWPVGFGPDPNAKFITTYFRHGFEVTDPTLFKSLTLRLRRDDGAVVYLNGAEVFRSNLPAGPLGAQTHALDPVGGGNETAFFDFPVDPRLLVAGANSVAVELHQHSPTTSDAAFDLELAGTGYGVGAAQVVRGPYLQQATAGGIRVRWRTDVATDSEVRWGAAPDQLLDSQADPQATKEHDVLVTGLQPETTYYYSVGSTGEVHAGGDRITLFSTPPAIGVARPVRFWVIGDSGTCGSSALAEWCARARAVRNAYLASSGGLPTDAWLMLGDNAYPRGTSGQYQKALFDVYPSLLRRTVLWPALGNHDGFNSDSATQSGPYFDLFSLPAAGEAGGTPSGTEAYYSFDHGSIHLVVLDSFGSDRDPAGAMLQWLEADLAATAADWLIALWHHPPYSKGSHDSDAPVPPRDIELAEMRAHALPILETYGVDLVLAGHSHTYERSMLLDGHYFDSTTLNAAHRLDDGAGHPGSPYVKPSSPPGRAPNEGAVYAVPGSSGRLDTRVGLHPAMVVTLESMGSLVIEVDGNVLEAAFVDEHRVVKDRFSIVKGCQGDTAGGDLDADGSCDPQDCRPDDPGVSADVLELAGTTLGELSPVSEELRACTSIRVGPGFVVGGGGDLVLEAGNDIRFADGFAVNGGGRVSGRIDPGLLPP